MAVKRVEPIWRRPEAATAPSRRPADASVEFAEYVRARLDWPLDPARDRPILRYSDRLALLKEAQRRGVGRFEANLVIARVLHQEGMGQTYEMRPKSGWVGLALVVGLVQGAIGMGLWWMLG